MPSHWAPETWSKCGSGNGKMWGLWCWQWHLGGFSTVSHPSWDLGIVCLTFFRLKHCLTYKVVSKVVFTSSSTDPRLLQICHCTVRRTYKACTPRNNTQRCQGRRSDVIFCRHQFPWKWSGIFCDRVFFAQFLRWIWFPDLLRFIMGNKQVARLNKNNGPMQKDGQHTLGQQTLWIHDLLAWFWTWQAILFLICWIKNLMSCTVRQ